MVCLWIEWVLNESFYDQNHLDYTRNSCYLFKPTERESANMWLVFCCYLVGIFIAQNTQRKNLLNHNVSYIIITFPRQSSGTFELYSKFKNLNPFFRIQTEQIIVFHGPNYCKIAHCSTSISFFFIGCRIVIYVFIE